MPRSRLLIPSLAIALIGAAGCGSSSSSSSTATTAKTTASTTPSTPAPVAKTKEKAKKGKTATKTATTAKLSARTYSVKLAGANEVPAGAPKGAGKAVVTLSPKKLQACWTFTALTGVTTPAAAHIHLGAKGTSGNVYIPLFAGAYKAKGCVPATAAQIKAIEANPHGYYVNIHNSKYPNGAVRAQL